MKKPNVEIGQCYRKNDVVYMVISELDYGYWQVQDTLDKGFLAIEHAKNLLKWERPFQNFG
jgi:hypothetical protein